MERARYRKTHSAPSGMGVAGGSFTVWTIKKILSQPASTRQTGFPLAFDILWSGVIYGLADALLFSVLPVLATWQPFTLLNWTTNWPERFLVGGIALIASLLVTVAYHLGYPEYQGKG
jgi:hypothetical protein